MFNSAYGRATTFPVRRDMPTSNQVMSDGEFEADWQSKLAGIPEFLGGEVSTTQDWAPGANLQSSAPFTPQYHAPGGPGVNSITRGQDYSFGAPGGTGIQSMTVGQDYNMQTPMAPGATGTLTASRSEMPRPNPEYARMMAEMQAAMQKRQEAQTANQQAYDGMLGQGQKNAVMGPGYANPGFGRVDGNAQNPYAVSSQANGNPAFAGYQPPDISGVYDPIAQTKELFWGL